MADPWLRPERQFRVVLGPHRAVLPSAFRIEAGTQFCFGSTRRQSAADYRWAGSPTNEKLACQASSSPSAAAASLAATSSNDDTAVSNPEREASMGLTSRRASKVVP